jgi:hypothetical protein
VLALRLVKNFNNHQMYTKCTSEITPKNDPYFHLYSLYIVCLFTSFG